VRAFSFFIHHAGSRTPELVFEVVSDEGRLRALASRALAESKDHLAVEIREDDRLLFSVDRNDVRWPDHRTPVSTPSLADTPARP
jgi:hypothetical protein